MKDKHTMESGELKPHREPEKDLVAAIVWRAVLEALWLPRKPHGGKGGGKHPKYKSDWLRMPKLQEETKREAWAWLRWKCPEPDEPIPWTFEWCCRELGVAPWKLLKQLEQMRADGYTMDRSEGGSYSEWVRRAVERLTASRCGNRVPGVNGVRRKVQRTDKEPGKD